jgi:hypothetical protein
MPHLYIRLLGIALLIACAFAQVPTRTIATLQLHVTDSHGGPVEDWNVTQLTDIWDHDWKDSVSATGTARLPVGEYVIGIDQHSFLPFLGKVSVREPTTHFIAGLQWGGAEDSAGRMMCLADSKEHRERVAGAN